MAFAPAKTIYIKTQREVDYDVLDNVTSFKEGWLYRPDGLYRDTGWDGTGEAAMVSGGAGTSTANIPVIGIPNETPVYNSWTTLKHTAPDEQTHVPWRQRYTWEYGIYIAIGGATIPEPPAPAFASATFSASNTTDVLTLVAHPFVGAETVYASIATNGFSLTEIYTVVKQSSSEIRLLKSDGTLLDVTTGVVNVTLTQLTTEVKPANLPEGVIFRAAPYKLSLVDPR